MRFRYTSRNGDEIEVRDLDALREHVATGRVMDETHLFDDLTGHFGPAVSHEAYRFVLDMADGGAMAFPGLEVTLAPETPESSEEFVERLHRERRAERDTLPDLSVARVNPYDETLRSAPEVPPTLEGPALPADPAGSGASEEPSDDEDAEGDALEIRRLPLHALTTFVARLGEGRTSASAGEDDDPRPAADRARRRRSRRERSVRRRNRSSEDGRGRLGRETVASFRTAGLAAVLVLSMGWLALHAQSAALEEDADDVVRSAVDRTGPPPLDPRGIGDRLAASEGIAFQHMVEGMDSLARAHRVFNVPVVWLEGAYLSDAAAHPQVEEYWERYQGFVEALRENDADLFRRSFLARLESLEVAPSVRSLRVAQATRRFEETQPLRAEMYAAMDDLARAALTLHDLMVSRADDITYTPLSRASAVRDPFLQVYTEDADLQEEIYGLLDRIFDDLEALHGETRWTRDALNDGVLEGIRATGADAAGEGTP